MSDVFLDFYTFVASQIGLVAIGYIIRGVGPVVKQWLGGVVSGSNESEEA
jgi:hypothetical protein